MTLILQVFLRETRQSTCDDKQARNGRMIKSRRLKVGGFLHTKNAPRRTEGHFLLNEVDIDLQDSACANVSRAPIIAAQRIDSDTATGAGVDEIVIAEVNADVRRAVGVGAEEDQIARDEVGRGNGHAHLELNVGSTRKRNTCVGEDVLDITGAVKAVGAGAAEYVGDADIIRGRRHHATSDVIHAAIDVGHIPAKECRVSGGTN